VTPHENEDLKAAANRLLNALWQAATCTLRITKDSHSNVDAASDCRTRSYGGPSS
jgi:hypothetical protein